MSEQDARPYPLKPFRADNGVALPPGTIPRYWAMIIHKLMRRHYGKSVPPLETLAEQGGFDPSVALDLLAGGDGTGKMFRRLIAHQQASVLGDLQIVTPGTRQYEDALREVRAEAEMRAKEINRFVFGYGYSKTAGPK